MMPQYIKFQTEIQCSCSAYPDYPPKLVQLTQEQVRSEVDSHEARFAKDYGIELLSRPTYNEILEEEVYKALKHMKYYTARRYGGLEGMLKIWEAQSKKASSKEVKNDSSRSDFQDLTKNVYGQFKAAYNV